MKMNWPVVASPPALLPNEVHVWCGLLEQPEPVCTHYARLLSADEQARADRFSFERDRRRFVVARGMLRVLLAGYLGPGHRPEALRFSYGAYGKPSLDVAVAKERVAGQSLCFNVSHSHEVALFACAWNRAVGVDIEHLRVVRQVEQLVERFFSAQEAATFRALPPAHRQTAFFRYWTSKEAYLKARGVGLANELKQVVVAVSGEPGEPGESDGPAVLLHPNGEPVSGWTLATLAPASGYVAALVGEGHGWRVRQWQLQAINPVC